MALEGRPRVTDPTPLNLATTDDLLTELASRFRSSLFVAINSTTTDDENQWYEWVVS